MAILTYEQYKTSWINDFKPKGTLPCYHEYLQREIYKQDYLDLFIYKRTFERVRIDGFVENYVKITGCKILEDLNIPDLICFFYGNNDKYIKVDYEYPWVDTDFNRNEKRCIKYVMIGEAAPANMAYYFYYILNLQKEKTLNVHKKTKEIIKDYKGYVSAPFLAFFGGDAKSCNNMDKKDILLKFANKGVILLDIFHFAIDYDTIRDHLNKTGVTKFYFKELMHEINLFNIKHKCKEDVKGVFIAPPKISHYLAKLLNRLKSPIIFRKGINTFSPPHSIKTGNDFFFISSSSKLLSGIKEITPPKSNKKPIQVPEYICCAYSGAMTVPHSLFIKKGFGLI